MAKRSKKPADLNRLAAAIVDNATIEEGTTVPESQQAQAGRVGGTKGGKTRAERMSPAQRSEAARRAARARWSKAG